MAEEQVPATEQVFQRFETRFHDAEAEAENVIDQVWKEFDKTLWNKRIKAKSWSFAAETSINVMLSQVDLCFCYVEKPEPIEGPSWIMQDELMPTGIDYWARRALPIVKRNDLAAYKQAANQNRRSLLSKKPHDEPPRAKPAVFDPLAPVSEEGRRIKLDDGMEADEEEIRYREAKLLEEKKLRDEEFKITERKRVEEVEKTKAVATESQMSKKPYTFDTEGNILWVELPNINKLPKVAMELPYHCKEDGSQNVAVSPHSLNKPRDARRKSLEDGFTKLPMEQPDIADIIELKPGVLLQAGSKNKSGPAREDKTMSLQGYQRFVLAQEQQ